MLLEEISSFAIDKSLCSLTPKSRKAKFIKKSLPDLVEKSAFFQIFVKKYEKMQKNAHF